MPTWKDVVQRANSDSQFCSRLKADPAAAAKEAGVEVPNDLKIEIVEQDENGLHLILGAKGYAPKVDEMLSRALNDASFKSQLVSNPKSCVESAIGEKLPPGFKVVVHEGNPGTVILSLKSDAAERELSEEDLDIVAGGGVLKRILNFLCKDHYGPPTPAPGGQTMEVDQSCGGPVDVYISY